MNLIPAGRALLARLAVVIVFVATLVPRVWGISHHFWLKTDQIRDWGIALGPLSSLPLVSKTKMNDSSLRSIASTA